MSLYIPDIIAERDEIKQTICRQEWTSHDQRVVREVDALVAELENYGLEPDYVNCIDDMADYAMEYARDHDGLSSQCLSWDYINWEAMGEGMKVDFVEVTYMGDTYYVS